MLLKAIKYTRFQGTAEEWSIIGKPSSEANHEWVTFENINLIVGKNASGKSNTIGVIRQLADLLAGDIKISNLIYDTGKYSLLFVDKEKKEINYELEFAKGEIQQELLTIGGVEKLNREKQTLFYNEIERFLVFQTEKDKLVASGVDSIQHPFLTSLQEWGKNLSHYSFGGTLGKNTLLRDINLVSADETFDFKETDSVAGVFVAGKQLFGAAFENQIIEDMANISYHIKSLSTIRLKFVSAPGFGLGVQEQDVETITDQREISQGMFRALSLIIQLNYSLSKNLPSCILIDDIGEGLDFDRSKKLIDLIIHKVKNSDVQVFMTTNDRFVMNKIPLEYWSVIHRAPKKAIFFNYRNSKNIFDDFRFTGLSNFDFLTSEFYREDSDNL